MRWEQLRAEDGAARQEALAALLAATEQPVDWAYEVWDQLVATLSHKDGHQRAIAAQLLCNLARSDPEQRVLRDFDALLAVTRDAKFVTARHSLQAIWKIGAVSPEHQRLLVERLAQRFREAAAEKNGTLVRYDIIEGMRKLYEQVPDAQLRELALALIATETESKYQKKYAAVWRKT
ncbi:MAG TPA: hypothetical protein PKD53_24640 [Chloroflexaceae bacterium]|nr:hypothetical protein [Chloroflexaceae bacterium]